MSIMGKLRQFVEDQFDVQGADNPEDIARFEELLLSYAKSYKLKRKSNIMKCIEKALVALVEKKIDQPDRVLVALAGAQGKIVYAKLTARELLADLSPKEYKQIIKSQKTEAIKHSADWLSGNNRITFLKNKKLLAQLLGEHFKEEDSLH